MNKEMSETLTRVGPGTRMGKLLRRYWVPALMSSEIAEPDSPQVRVLHKPFDITALEELLDDIQARLQGQGSGVA